MSETNVNANEEQNIYAFQVETKEDLKDLSVNEIAKSLIFYHKSNPETALLMAHFVNNLTKPSLKKLVKDFTNGHKSINNYYKIPDDMVIEMKKIVDINEISGYNSNVRYLSK